MRLNPARGLKFGGLSALSFGVVTPINNYIMAKELSSKLLLGQMVFVFILFAIIGTLTSKIGSDFGE